MIKRLCVLLLGLSVLACGGIGCRSRAKTVPFKHEAVWRIPPSETGIPAPRSLCVSTNGELVVLDTIGRVLVYDPTGTLARKWSMPETSVGRPEGIVELRDGSILVADTHYHRLVRFTAAGAVIDMWGGIGEGPGEFIYPVAVTQGPDGLIYVAEYGGNDRIQVFTEAGEVVRSFGGFGTGEGDFQRCSGLAFLEGHLYVADAINNRVQVYTPEGTLVASHTKPGGVPLRFPYDIAETPSGELAVIEYSAGRICLMRADGSVIGHYGRTGRDEGAFATPWGIAAGADGRIFVADTGNHRIVVVHP
jgi:iron(III) transport system ATP-binding protein